MDLAQAQIAINTMLVEYPPLQCTQQGEVLQVGTAEKPDVITIEFRGERGWEVATEAGHIHVFDDDEVANQVKWLLTGADQFVSEFRGDTLMAQWTESWNGKSYERAGGLAIFGCIIDADEWKLWPGETWRQVATQMRVVEGEVLVHKSEIQGENTSFEPLAWILDMLGPAPDGLKWTVGAGDPSFFYLAPIGWRQIGKHDGFRDLADREEPNVLLRCRFSYRQAETPNTSEAGVGIPPGSNKYFFTPPEEGWAKHEWHLEYGVDDYDCLAILELFYLNGHVKEAEPYFVLLSAHIGQSVFLLPNE